MARQIKKMICSSNERTRPIAAVLLTLLALVALDAGRPARGAPPKVPSYTIVKLDDYGGLVTESYAADINNLGEVVGQVNDGVSTRAVYWHLTTSGSTTGSTLNILNGGQAAALGINDSLAIVGGGIDPAGPDLGLYWSWPGADPIVLPPLPGHDASVATAINDNGVICGVSRIEGGGEATQRAVAWRVNIISGNIIISGPVALPDTGSGSRATSLSDNNSSGIAKIAGTFLFPDSAAALWGVQTQADGTLVAVPAAVILDAPALANGINNSGAVCGMLAENPNEAAVWSGSGRRVLARSKFVTAAWANAISNRGVIVGTGSYLRQTERGERAVVWPSAASSTILLDTFLASGSSFIRLTDAFDVNDQGLILGWGAIGGAQTGSFVAVPK